MAYEPQRLRQLSSKESEALGLPSGYRQYSPFPFRGLNQQDSRYAMPDPEFFWIENFVLPGSGNLRAVPGESTTDLYTATGGLTIVFFFFYDIGETSYCAVFFNDGTAKQINVDTAAVTTITSVVGEFYDSSNSTALPACVQWGTKYLLISNNNTPNDYWIWDGSILYTRGTIGPEPVITGGGVGYDGSQPTMTAFGGHLTAASATFEAVVSGGAVALLSVTASGSGCLPNETYGIRFNGGGTPDDAARPTAVLTSTTVAAIEVVDGGFGYTSAPTVAFSSGAATATATVTSGRVTSIAVTGAGSGYTAAPTISFSGGSGAGAKAAAYLTPVGLATITLTSAGTNYEYPPAVTVHGGGGTTPASVYCLLTSTGVATVEIIDGGAGYISNPTENVSNVGASGSGFTFTAAIADGKVINITKTSSGSGYLLPPYPYVTVGSGILTTGTNASFRAHLLPVPLGTIAVGNSGLGYIDAPTLLLDPGYNNAAYAYVLAMPFGVSGAAIETFQSRVWTIYPKERFGSNAHTNGTMLVSDASDLIGFPTVFVNDQSNLRNRFVGIKQANGYLYTIGDSSVNVISNVQTTGDPAITTFNNQNVDPQVGTTFRDTIQALGRSVYFANKNGVFRITGGSAQCVSDKLTNLFANALWPDSSPTVGITPTAAIVHIHNVRFYVLLLTITDPFTAAARNVMLAYDEQDWWVLSQETAWTLINSRVVESQLHCYGTDGTTITRLFSTPSATLAKVIRSKLYGADQAGFIKLFHNIAIQGQDKSTDSSGVAATLTINTEQPGTAASILLPATADLTDARMFVEGFGDVRAGFLGFTFGSTSKDFELMNVALGYTIDQGPLGSSSKNAPAA